MYRVLGSQGTTPAFLDTRRIEVIVTMRSMAYPVNGYPESNEVLPRI